jgi:hypothetical protein
MSTNRTICDILHPPPTPTPTEPRSDLRSPPGPSASTSITHTTPASRPSVLLFPTYRYAAPQHGPLSQGAKKNILFSYFLLTEKRTSAILQIEFREGAVRAVPVLFVVQS